MGSRRNNKVGRAWSALQAALMWGWLLGRRGDLVTVPHPTDEPLARSAGPDPDRILLFGSGPAVGWGVASHQLGLAGHLARGLAASTGRGAEIVVVADRDIDAGSANRTLKAMDLGTFDAILVTIGVSDAIRLIQPARWTRELSSLLETIEHTLPPHGVVIVAGIHPLRGLCAIPRAFTDTIDAHARELNRATRLICEPPSRAIFVPLGAAPVLPDGQRSGATYTAWARQITETLARMLDRNHVRKSAPASMGGARVTA